MLQMYMAWPVTRVPGINRILSTTSVSIPGALLTNFKGIRHQNSCEKVVVSRRGDYLLRSH